MSSPARETGWTLVLLRHAKSSWAENVPDHMRPLAGRGRRDAPGAGRWLRTAGYVPDLVLCSTARRTRQTWQLAEAGLLEAGESGAPGLAPPPVSYEQQIYGAAVADLLDLLRRQPASARTLLVVGHEPGMSELSLTLTGAADEPVGQAADEPVGQAADEPAGQAADEPVGQAADEPAGSDLARLRAKFPTAAIAVLSSAGDWSQLGPGRARLARFVTPRDLRAGGSRSG